MRFQTYKNGDNSLVALFDHVAYNLVVEVLNVFPLNALLAILILLRFQRELNKQLLKFLIAVVDAKLFEAAKSVSVVMDTGCCGFTCWSASLQIRRCPGAP